MWEMWTRDASQSRERKQIRWFDLRLQPTSFGVFNWFWVFDFHEQTQAAKPQNIFFFGVKNWQMHSAIRHRQMTKKMLFTVFQEGTIWSNWMIWQERIVNQFLWFPVVVSVLHRYLREYSLVQVLDPCLHVFRTQYLGHVINNNKIERKTKC